MAIEQQQLKNIIEAALMAYDEPLSVQKLISLFDEEEQPDAEAMQTALTTLQEECATRGVELKQVASGYRYQAKQDTANWLKKLWEERPSRYSKAFLETLALIAYRQPITRAEIEDVRGVAVNPIIIKTLLEREWIKVIGHREVPGRPELLGTTKLFLDYFNLKSLSELPTLQELENLDLIGTELEKQMQLLLQEQAEIAIAKDKAAADEIMAEIEKYGVELVDEEIIETEIAEIEAKQEEIDELLEDSSMPEEPLKEELIDDEVVFERVE